MAARATGAMPAIQGAGATADYVAKKARAKVLFDACGRVVHYIGVQCDGTVGKYIFSTSSDCSGATSECQAITGDLTTIPTFENCYFGGESGTCDTMNDERSRLYRKSAKCLACTVASRLKYCVDSSSWLPQYRSEGSRTKKRRLSQLAGTAHGPCVQMA